MGRYTKAIKKAHEEACERYRRAQKAQDPCKEPPPYGPNGILPYPRKLRKLKRQTSRLYNSTFLGGYIIKPGDPENTHGNLLGREHTLWVRVFDHNDNLLFNHYDHEYMLTSQMIKICSKLVTYLNTLSENEIGVQIALGTFEAPIVSALTPVGGHIKHHAWHSMNLKDDTYSEIDALAIIKQSASGEFSGKLYDDIVQAVFQL